MTPIEIADVLRRIVAGVFGLVVLTAVGSEIRVTGSDLLGPAFARTVQDFEGRIGRTAKLDLRGTRPGIETLVAGRADIGLFLLPSGETPPGDPLTTRIVAWQVTVVAVPETLPLSRLTLGQLKEIFGQKAGGEVLCWEKFGVDGEWADQPVRPLALSPDAGLAWPQLRSLLPGAGEDGLLVGFEERHELLAQALRTDPTGIAVAGGRIAAESGLRLLPVAAEADQPAFPPTSEAVHAGRYPLRMPLWAAFRRADAPRLLPFLKFLLGPETAQALARADFMPLPEGDRVRLAFEFEEMR